MCIRDRYGGAAPGTAVSWLESGGSKSINQIGKAFMKVKSKDIAKKLGLSPATVSLVLNNKPGISPETRDRVFSLLQEYGYEQPKAPQLTPASNKTLQFVIYQKHGLVVSDTPFFSTLTEAINREARASGYSLTITYIDEQKDDIEAILSDMVQNSPSGLLILATEMFAEDIGPFQRLGIPPVSYTHLPPAFCLPSLCQGFLSVAKCCEEKEPALHDFFIVKVPAASLLCI